MKKIFTILISMILPVFSAEKNTEKKLDISISEKACKIDDMVITIDGKSNPKVEDFTKRYGVADRITDSYGLKLMHYNDLGLVVKDAGKKGVIGVAIHFRPNEKDNQELISTFYYGKPFAGNVTICGVTLNKDIDGVQFAKDLKAKIGNNPDAQIGFRNDQPFIQIFNIAEVGLYVNYHEKAQLSSLEINAARPKN